MHANNNKGLLVVTRLFHFTWDDTSIQKSYFGTKEDTVHFEKKKEHN